MRLLHLADIHPNNAGTLAGRVVTDGAGRNETLVDLDRSLEFVLRVAGERQCELAVLPGDLFDSPRPHMNEVEVISRFVRRLAGLMPVVIIPGNHDLSQNTGDATALACLQGIPSVHVVERPTTLTFKLRSRDALVSCLPYPTKGRVLASIGPVGTSEEVTAVVNDGLGKILQGMALESVPGTVHLLLAHGSVTGTILVGDQPRSLAHDIQLPLDRMGFADYVALGHIHQHQQVGPKAWYSGSLMRHSFGEGGEQKGFCLVEVEAGQLPSVTFIHNLYARAYLTVSARDLWDARLQVPPTTVVRIKDVLTPEQYESARGLLQDVAERYPFSQQDIELTTVTRARDAGMQAMATMEDALKRALPDVPESEWPELLNLHAALGAKEEAR